MRELVLVEPLPVDLQPKLLRALENRKIRRVGGYDEVVLLRDIPFQSHCEHHMAPITGKASIAYLPRDRVVDSRRHAQNRNPQRAWKVPSRSS